MKKYREYMDNVRASDTLHQRLLGLEASGKRPVPWKRYGTIAAALVLACGLGAWGLGREDFYEPLVDYNPVAPEIADEPVPDIAIVGPGDVTEPGMKTIGGYDVVDRSGAKAMVTHYVLPYIEYGPPSSTGVAASLAPPEGGMRDATRDDVLALVGGEDALTAHLNWGGYELSGTVGFETDGTVWMMSLWGEGQDTAFSLELSPNRMPPTCCVVIGEERTITDVWGVEVSGVNSAGAYGDTERGIYMDVSREVEFIAKGVGCRLTVYGTQDKAVEELASRFVRWAVLEGLDLSGISQGVAKPLETDPNYSVGEPNYEDGVPAVDPDDAMCSGYPVPEGGVTCPDCGAPYPAGTGHACKISDGHPLAHTCEICGEIYMAGTEHHCAGGTYTCGVCGQTLSVGMEHSHAKCEYGPSPATNICEVCGQPIQDGVAHSHSDDHHGSHH